MHKVTMAVAALGALISAAMAVWNADPITNVILALVAAFMLTVVVAPYAAAFYIARRDDGPPWTQALLLLAVVFAAGLSIYVNYVFANSVGKAKDPLMLAGAIVYQAIAIGGAVFLNQVFRK
jgi:hypothetical protein